MEENTKPETQEEQTEEHSTPDETEPTDANLDIIEDLEVETAAGEEPGEAVAAEDYVVGEDNTRWAKGDLVKIAETFPSYRGEEGVITALRVDPIGGNFYVADVELTKQRAVGTNEPIWFNNVPLSQLEKV